MKVHRQFRKPLIVFSPKSLLRHPKAKSPLNEFDDQADDQGIIGVRFKRVIMDDTGLLPKSRAPRPPQEPEKKRLVLCSGKVFYELHAERERLGHDSDVAVVRLEQLAPFPFDLVRREMYRYPNAEVLWCQVRSCFSFFFYLTLVVLMFCCVCTGFVAHTPNTHTPKKQQHKQKTQNRRSR